MLNRLFGRDLHSVLNEKKAIKIKGVSFVIKKIDALAFLDGSRVMVQVYDTYRSKKGDAAAINIAEKKIREHLSEVIVAGSVSPKFTHKEEADGIYVNELFKDMDIANKLYEEILALTYGKKKLSS
jgi:hypothetical protein